MNRRVWMRVSLAAGAVVLVTSLASACSPMYVIRAGIAEAKILRARRPIPDVILDPATDDRTKTKLTFVVEARNYAIDVFELDVGRSYTSFSKLESDTLALVLSAARQDQLTPKTWWFPIVGTVPYKGYFNEDAAMREQVKLEEDGFDTFLRPTAAFSTLGWFADPLLSTLVRLDEVDLVETVLHELSHTHHDRRTFVTHLASPVSAAFLFLLGLGSTFAVFHSTSASDSGVCLGHGKGSRQEAQREVEQAQAHAEGKEAQEGRQRGHQEGQVELFVIKLRPTSSERRVSPLPRV